MLLAIGSPMLDILVNVEELFLKKYGLELNSAKRIEDKDKEMLNQIYDKKKVYLCGGSVTNTVRIFNWICKNSYPVVYVGAIGKDEHGEIIKKQLCEENIEFKFDEIEDFNTGTCYVLLNGNNRSLITDLGASKCLKFSKIEGLLTNAKIVYISAYLIDTSCETALNTYNACLKANKIVAINLGAPNVCKKHPIEIQYMYENADIIFGNETEHKTMADLYNVKSKELKKMFIDTNESCKIKCKRIIVMTRANESVYVLKDCKFHEFDVPSIIEEDIVDTNAAGDAFVAGFLSQFVVQENLDKCVECGIRASREILKNPGCSFNKNLVYNSNFSLFQLM